MGRRGLAGARQPRSRRRWNESSRGSSWPAAKRPKIVKLAAGANLVEQGDEADDLFLLLNGVLLVEVDGEAIAELGPGAVVGERAGLEAGRRTATLRAVTNCTVAKVAGGHIDPIRLTELAEGHKREQQGEPADAGEQPVAG